MYWNCVAAKIDFLEHLNDSKEPLKIRRFLVWDENSATFKSSRCLLTATEEIKYREKIVKNCYGRGFLRKIFHFWGSKGDRYMIKLHVFQVPVNFFNQLYSSCVFKVILWRSQKVRVLEKNIWWFILMKYEMYYYFLNLENFEMKCIVTQIKVTHTLIYFVSTRLSSLTTHKKRHHIFTS